ncbi:Uncaracterized surface protein containing fasciclin (FAS1) repeats [Halomonas shengliensis]|uniref:Uncaracterized surface protein containing fasciclin (FAS1) repeats n=1 Tax=Halomonas shengliensis TaxID=419597 RepID=A0A1H0DR15_9GAMM|nr:fasciclin domain-containing protein [Halomonas shengliensis]SDN72421.1 Uncaracterized surface protein containing fasciclin (FAS1) repeats [Halomonas shengliensis]
MIHKKMKTVGWMTAAAAGVLLSAAAQADHHGMKKDIVDTAVEAGQFETLVAAVQAAGLVETLKGEGPFTVFAPTDEAFAALPEGTVESLLEEENRDQLQSILTYHVVSGKIMAEDAMAADSATTLQGQDLTITTMDGSVMIDDATVIQADIETSNGVIHVIDSVLMPE